MALKKFSKAHSCSEFTLLSKGEQIRDLRMLRSALYVEIPPEVYTEITGQIKLR